MSIADTISRDMKRRPAKAATLGVLFAVMVALFIRAAFQLRPQAASAGTHGTPGVAVMGIPTFAKDETAPLVAADAEQRIRESKELWHRLREVRGPGVAAVFSFDAAYYPPDPNRKVAVVPEHVEAPLPLTPPAPRENPEAIRRALELAVREQARGLGVKSTTVTATGKPWAIVNQQLLSVGDRINGFEITAIRSREVEFRKDGVTVPVKMPDEFRGQ
jgi:hypothetical protein